MRNVQDATYTAFGASEKPHQAGALARLCDISGRDTNGEASQRLIALQGF